MLRLSVETRYDKRTIVTIYSYAQQTNISDRMHLPLTGCVKTAINSHNFDVIICSKYL